MPRALQQEINIVEILTLRIRRRFGANASAVLWTILSCAMLISILYLSGFGIRYPIISLFLFAITAAHYSERAMYYSRRGYRLGLRLPNGPSWSGKGEVVVHDSIVRLICARILVKFKIGRPVTKRVTELRRYCEEASTLAIDALELQFRSCKMTSYLLNSDTAIGKITEAVVAKHPTATVRIEDVPFSKGDRWLIAKVRGISMNDLPKTSTELVFSIPGCSSR